MDHGTKAAELFVNGYNCAQSVAVAFCDVTGLEEKFAAKMVSSFGGGMGRLREVCGAVSGMCLVAGLGPEHNLRRDGSYEYYISEPVVENDAKGVAPFILSYTELLSKRKA